MKSTVTRRKTVWHPLSLQQLAPSQFTLVVNRILSGRYSLIAETLAEAALDGEQQDRPRNSQPKPATT